MDRCPTTHGPFRCDLSPGHPGECETEQGPRRIVVAAVEPGRDLDSGRELMKAIARIATLEKALHEIRTTPCSAPDEVDGTGAACLCCMHDRMIAAAALSTPTPEPTR